MMKVYGFDAFTDDTDIYSKKCLKVIQVIQGGIIELFP